MTSIIKVDNIQNSSGTDAISIDSNGVIIQPSKPAFSAFMSADQTLTTVNTWHTISNLNVTNNSADWASFSKGGATVPNGIFTAPVAGVYSFHVNMRIDSVGSGYVWSMISVNNNSSPDKHINNLEGSPPTNYTSHILSGIYSLDAGDTVRVKVYLSSDTNTVIQNYSMFSGYLVG